MNNKILIVDDEQNLLDSLKRQLRKKFHITTALSPEIGLDIITKEDPFAIILSDLRMPIMDGIEFLSKAREITPNTVRIMLTGNADLQNAIQAVNQGNIYRFLTKPCDSKTLLNVLTQGIEQYRLITAEKELLEKTLKGSIKVLTELLSLVNPEAFGRASRIKRYASMIAQHLAISSVWQIETAAMLSQIGCVTLPENAIKRLYKGKELKENDARLFAMHPKITFDLLSHIPRMQRIADIIICQDKRFDGSDNYKDSRRGRSIPIGARILKVVLDFDMLESKGYLQSKALKYLKLQHSWYDPDVLKALEQVLGIEAMYKIKNVMVKELRPYMIICENVNTLNGQLLMSKGQEINSVLIERLKNFTDEVGVKEPIRVFDPTKTDDY